jgi:subtilisin family serine protease
MKHRTLFGTVIVICVVALVAGLSTAGWAVDATPGDADRNGSASAPYVAGELLVKYRASQGRNVASLYREIHDVRRIRFLDSMEIDHVRLPEGMSVAEAIEIYADDPEVEYVEPNYYRYLSAVPNDPGFGLQWGLSNSGQNVNGVQGLAGADIAAMGAWDTSLGEGVLVAIIDSGVDYNHVDLNPNMWINGGEIPGNGRDDDGNGYPDDVVGWNFYNDNSDPMDRNGHGTHVAGSAGARGNNGVGVSGVSWAPRIMALRFTDERGRGTLADEIAAVNYANIMGAQIINMSFGGGFYSASERTAIEATGALVVCAAGNDGTDNDARPQYPSSYPSANIISVAATDQNDNLASFSNFGAGSVDVAAPGTNIVSTWLGGGYAIAGGTSMAAGLVSGAAALIKASASGLDATGMKSVLMNTVDPLPSLAGRVVSGGRINAQNAVTGAGSADDDDGGGPCFIGSVQNGGISDVWRCDHFVLGALALLMMACGLYKCCGRKPHPGNKS